MSILKAQTNVFAGILVVVVLAVGILSFSGENKIGGQQVLRLQDGECTEEVFVENCAGLLGAGDEPCQAGTSKRTAASGMKECCFDTSKPSDALIKRTVKVQCPGTPSPTPEECKEGYVDNGDGWCCPKDNCKIVDATISKCNKLGVGTQPWFDCVESYPPGSNDCPDGYTGELLTDNSDKVKCCPEDEDYCKVAGCKDCFTPGVGIGNDGLVCTRGCIDSGIKRRGQPICCPPETGSAASGAQVVKTPDNKDQCVKKEKNGADLSPVSLKFLAEDNKPVTETSHMQKIKAEITIKNSGSVDAKIKTGVFTTDSIKGRLIKKKGGKEIQSKEFSVPITSLKAGQTAIGTGFPEETLTDTTGKYTFDIIIDKDIIDESDIENNELKDAATLKVTPTPIAHWKLDEGSGAMAKDSIGKNDGNLKFYKKSIGTEVGPSTEIGPVWVSGRTGEGLFFDGDDDYVDIKEELKFADRDKASAAF